MAPAMRRQGFGRKSYHRFYDVCLADGRTAVSSCTSPVNRLSAVYHQDMGFALLTGEETVTGFPGVMDYLRQNDPKVVFHKNCKVN